MRACLLTVLRAGALTAAALLPAATASALQAAPTGGPPGAAPGPDAGQPDTSSAAEAAAIEALAALQKGVEERQANTVKDALLKLDPIWSEISPRTTQKLVKAIGTMFSKLKPIVQTDIGLHDRDPNRPRQPSDDEPDKYAEDSRAPVIECYSTAVGLLADKPQGPETLLPVLKLPHVKAWPEVQALVLQGLGFRDDPALMKDFEGYLDSASPEVASQAARALGRYSEQSMEVKRRAVTSLVAALEAADRAAAREAGKVREGDPTPAADYRSSIYVGFHEALVALTRQNLDKAPAWREWFTAHGKDAAW